MKTFLTYLIGLIGVVVYPQNPEVWIAFKKKDSQLIGFKDSKGQIKIEPKFMGFTIAKKFEDIIAVMEEKETGYKTYYLTKTGEKVGKDSLFIYDNRADCEHEGYIRFRDKKTDKVGLFNKDGNVVIPAVYDALSRAHDGLVWGLMGAQKKCLDEHNKHGCEHFSWEGGEEFLITTQNKIAVVGFKHAGKLDMYSMTVESEATTDTTKKSYKGLNGKYYTFLDVERNFNRWMKNKLLPHLRASKAAGFMHDSITSWNETIGWVTEPRKEFGSNHFKELKKSLFQVKKRGMDFFVTRNGLNPFIYDSPGFEKYFTNCGEARIEKYPVMTLVLNHSKDGARQDHFEFLKTDNGYRLIGMSLQNDME
ncbi:WG repeat-containing protein [Croceitalea marina]|uniref:WG repeat-containing protein n=1 Tax=Croceitalea marina TaxID=1775166 RepID=A0ABW5MRK2_9FLAO